jgi:hypothetical protein
MKAKEDKYESICAKLHKLKALADQGYEGEAENARRLIQSICTKYGIIQDDLFNADKRRYYVINTGASKDMKSLYFRCLASVTDISKMEYINYRGKIKLYLTTLEYVESVAMFDWHKANYKKELKRVMDDFNSAYLLKHDLLLPKERSGEEKPEKNFTPDDYQRLMRICSMKDGMEDTHYHKRIE